MSNVLQGGPGVEKVPSTPLRDRPNELVRKRRAPDGRWADVSNAPFRFYKNYSRR